MPATRRAVGDSCLAALIDVSSLGNRGETLAIVGESIRENPRWRAACSVLQH
jgi:hypothetical protein